MRTNFLIGLILLLSLQSLAQTTWYKYPGNPVFEPGKSGEWDMVKIVQTVLFEDGRYHMWYKGWPEEGPAYVGIGYATSTDGILWQKYEANPLDFTCEGTSWDTALFSLNIIKKDAMYLMWYGGMDKKSNIYSIGYAWSENGLQWTKYPEPVLRPGKDEEWDAAGINGAKILFDGIQYQMWYAARNSVNWVQKIGYATSEDGVHWNKHPANPVLDGGGPGSWGEHSIGVYSVNFNGSGYEMWYDGWDRVTTQVGYATSVDGVKWIKSPDNPVLEVGELGYWDTWIARMPSVVSHDSIYRMWYYGHDYSRGNIGYATTSVDEAKAWETAKINKPQRILKVQVFNRQEYINVDSLLGILGELSGKELIDACNRIALAYSLNDSEKSLGFAEKALELSAKENYPSGRAMALYSIGNIQYIKDNYSAALANHLSALWLFDSLDMQFEQGNLLCQIASIHSYTGSHDLSCRYFKQAVDVFERGNDTVDIIIPLGKLGYSYLEFGDTASAIITFRKSLSLSKAIHAKWLQGGAYEGIGICHSGHNLDSALWNFNEANILWDHAWPENYNLLITAEAYFAAGPDYYDDAEEYFFRSFPGLSNGKKHKVRLHLGAAELYFNTGRYKGSKEFLDVALDECQRLLNRQDYRMYASLNEKLDADIDLKLAMEKIYRLYYRIDSATSNRESAFEHFILATHWKDSIYSEWNRKRTAMMQGTYETESTQNQIALLEKDNELKNLTLRKSRIFLFVLGVLVILIIVSALIYIRNRRIRTKYEIELERVKSEKLLELDRLKSRFFANVSHEFRTPLTLIMGPLDRLNTATGDNEIRKEVRTAKKYAEKLRVLINNLLSISKLESGKMHLRASETDIVQLSKRYLQAFESLAEQKKIVLKFESESRELITFIDRGKYEQVLNNLLSNALKFTGENGRIHVGISGQPSSVNFPDGSVRINVSDTGHGIALEHQQHIFDRFYQLDQPEISYFEGSGIGLALCKELVKLHHGSISVNSIEGKGSTFSISLPLGKKHLKPEEIVDEDKLSLGQEISGQPLHDASEEKTTCIDDDVEDNNKPILLIVEDNADMRGHISEYFINNFHILEAADGQDGYDKSTEHIPDIIISDVMMPKLDGNELCRMLKADERTSHIPVILLTARATKEGRIEGLETGADDFITKPFDGSELLIRVYNLIAQRLKLRELLERRIRASHQMLHTDFSDSNITSMDESFLRKVIKVVEEEYTDPQFNIKALSLAVGLGRVQLNRKIKALTGQTTVSFIRVFRLNRASELIKAKSATIAEIAYDVGFSSPSYFSECFRAYFGKLPSEMNGNQQE